MDAYAQGRQAAAEMYKVAGIGDWLGQMLHHTYNLGSAGVHGMAAGGARFGRQSANLGAKGHGSVISALGALPSSVLTGLRAFHNRGGTQAAVGLGGPALALYGAHQLYNNEIKPRLFGHDQQPDAYPMPYAGMF